MKIQPSEELQKTTKISLGKTLLFFIAFIFISVSGRGQTVNGIPIKDLQSDYVEIVGTSTAGLFSRKMNVFIDFGQQVKVFGRNQMVVKDAKGEDMEFNSMIDALNFMSQNGYSFVQAYGFATTDSNYIYHYLLRKSKPKDEEGEKVVN